ncbi:MAG: tRNA (adenosine(37)-N6)-threonylcarbamoyltransferase complex dimerization subunit type 1 TsaB [Clostridia bacterium]|nr:tRNA (adenosine(37)-N6)-threonylcarbamoyltransferase complex dimerization subunit type 1 TsaB [Clostridia bacterium]
MKILAIDSTAKICTAALCENESLLSLKVENAGMTHSETLLPMIEGILGEQNITVPDVDLFALSAGPGSFTGVRIGAATVKGLCFGRDTACVGVSSLEALAYNYINNEGIVASAMDARRDQVYFALFRVREGKVERLCKDMAVPTDEACELCLKYGDEPLYLSGDGAHLLYARLKEKTDAEPIYDEQRAGQNAYSVALCGYRAYLAGEGVSDRELRPTYLRLAQAERERLEKLGEAK